jgi:hypothetical protein
MSDLVKRLRETASKGVSVWGDLQMEAAKEIEILTAEVEAYASAMDRMKSAFESPQPTMTDAEILKCLVSVDPETKRLPPGFRDFARAILLKMEAK